MADQHAMRITFLQSADSVRYARMVFLSSQTVQTYCAKNNFGCDISLGIRYGGKPWHAALNRITILKEYLDRQYRGWVFYVDADAYVADLDFDLKGFLEARSDFALIASPSGVVPPRWWDINNGVFAINLSHSLAAELVNRWFERLRSIPEDVLAAEERWGDVADDQEMMHAAMLEVEGLEHAVSIDEYSHLINWNGLFIRQIVRETGSLEQRTRRLGLCVEAVLSQYEGLVRNAVHQGSYDDARAQANEEFVQALYKVLLRRPADPGGFRAALQGLANGTRSFEEELASCLTCDEFNEKIDVFANQYLSDTARERLCQDWAP